MSGYVIPVDPSNLSSRFKAPDEGLDPEPEEEDVQELLQDSYEERIAPLLERIPQREADLIYLYFVERKRQADIAVIFNITQAAVSYRLDRGLKRIKFLLSIPPITEEGMRRDLPGIFKQIDVDIFVNMYETTCQSEVATRLGITQGRVRHRFLKAVKVLEAAAKENKIYEPYSIVFSTICNKGYNLLRSVSLPQWASKGKDECF